MAGVSPRADARCERPRFIGETVFILTHALDGVLLEILLQFQEGILNATTNTSGHPFNVQTCLGVTFAWNYLKHGSPGYRHRP